MKKHEWEKCEKRISGNGVISPIVLFTCSVCGVTKPIFLHGAAMFHKDCEDELCRVALFMQDHLQPCPHTDPNRPGDHKALDAAWKDHPDFRNPMKTGK